MIENKVNFVTTGVMLIILLEKKTNSALICFLSPLLNINQGIMLYEKDISFKRTIGFLTSSPAYTSEGKIAHRLSGNGLIYTNLNTMLVMFSSQKPFKACAINAVFNEDKNRK